MKAQVTLRELFLLMTIVALCCYAYSLHKIIQEAAEHRALPRFTTNDQLGNGLFPD